MSRTALLPSVATALESLPDGSVVTAYITTGFDGAGSQSTANQKSRNAYDQGSRESAHVCLRVIKDANGNVVYDNPHKSSCYGMRPWLQQPVKENRESLKVIHDEFMNEEIDLVKTGTSNIKLASGKIIIVKHVVQPWLVDGKAIKDVCGLGGAFCTKCKCSKADAHNLEKARLGYDLDRDMKEVEALARSLMDSETGEIPRY